MVYTLLSRQLFYAGSREEALKIQMKAVQVYEGMNEREITDAAQVVVLLAEGLILNGEAHTEKAESIGKRALSLVEQSPVGTSPKDQLILLSNALNTLAEIYKTRNQNSDALPLTERFQALTLALKNQGALS